MRERLDKYLVRNKYFESRSMAQAAIMEGRVKVGGRSAVKPGTLVRGDAEVYVTPILRRFVSRGGDKLEAALKEFGVDVEGAVALDVGASTGGFTDCLLKKGASRVIAVDVGYGQLDYTLRKDSRVSVLERVNARYLTPEELPLVPSVATVDVSFISLKKILPAVMRVLVPDGITITLVKPQFEAGPSKVGKGGIVRDQNVHIEVMRDLIEWLESEGMPATRFMISPLRGAKGNVEFFLYIPKQKGMDGVESVDPDSVKQCISGFWGREQDNE